MTRPNLYCAQCYTLYDKDGVKPACKRGGCDVEDLATDQILNSAVESFMAARLVAEFNGILDPLKDFYREAEIVDDPITILALERIFAERKRQDLQRQQWINTHRKK